MSQSRKSSNMLTPVHQSYNLSDFGRYSSWLSKSSLRPSSLSAIGLTDATPTPSVYTSFDCRRPTRSFCTAVGRWASVRFPIKAFDRSSTAYVDTSTARFQPFSGRAENFNDSRFTRTREIVLNIIFNTTSFLICWFPVCRNWVCTLKQQCVFNVVLIFIGIIINVIDI